MINTMTSPEDLSPKDIESQLPSLISDYLTLPHGGNENGVLQQETIQTFTSQKAQNYYEIAKENAWTAAKGGKYDEGVKIAKSALRQLHDQKFSSDDERAAKILLTRRLGRIYEHQATFGEGKLPQTHPGRRQHFIQAAFYYMEADKEMGLMTEFAGRAAEALGGAGLGDVSVLLLTAFFGDNLLINPSSQDVATLISNSRKIVGQKTGGGNFQFWGKGGK